MSTLAWLKKNFSVVLLTSALLIFGMGMAFSQEACPEGRDYKTVTETYTEKLRELGNTEHYELKDDFLKHFASAYKEVTGADAPEGMDLLQSFPVPPLGLTLLVAYKEGCALGSAQIPSELMEAVLQKMYQNRAQN